MKIIECTVEEYLKLQKMQDDIDTKKKNYIKIGEEMKKMSKQKIKKIRRQAIIEVLLYEAFVLFSAGIMIYGILF